MTTQLTLLSTCGTSLLTNGATPDTQTWLKTIANKNTLPTADAQRLEEHVAACKNRLLEADANKRSSIAELDSIAAVLQRWPSRRVQHLLVHTDTVAGRATADVVAAVLERNGGQVQLLTAGGLQTDDFPSFHAALDELTDQIEKWMPASQKSSTMVFNLTAGFKSVSAYLQAFGMFHADRCVFLFDGASALMEIPRLPARLADADEVREHLKVFRRLACRYVVSEQEATGVPDSLLLVSDGGVTTSVWGDVVWGRVRKTLLGESLLDPLSPKLVVDDAVRKAFNGLQQEDRRVQVNEALDALSAYLDLEHEPPKSNTFKKLSGNPKPPATHEMYLWSDGDAWRLFGHYENSCFVADFLGPHL
jgi:putative CRISPR-associated protein (TIGR02619 family)